MKKIFCVTCFLIAFVLGAMAKGDIVPQYDITGAGSGTEGTILVKVYIYAKSAKDEDLKRAAVHGVVFRGCSGNESGARQPAMAPANAEQENAAFCESFFAADGACQKFASVIAGSYDRVKKKDIKPEPFFKWIKRHYEKNLKKQGLCVLFLLVSN